MISFRRFSARVMCMPILLLTLCATPSLYAQGAIPRIGVVRAGNERAMISIAVPAFTPIGAQKFDQALFSSVIGNDLEVSGYFSRPTNEKFVLETNMLDEADKTIHYAEWKRIGVYYLVKGSYEIQNNVLRVIVKTYDTVSPNFIFGREYTKYSVGEARQLAHRISDDIMERVIGEPGVASTQLLFVRKDDPYGRRTHVAMIDADGGGETAMSPTDQLTATPCWGANGTEIYYTTWAEFNPDLIGMLLKSKATWWVSRHAGFNMSPDWSEKRRLIALTMTYTGNSELFTMTREGKELRQLTFNKAIDSSPAWSRDGSQIAFTSQRSGSPQIWILDLDSLTARRLTYQGDYNDGAAWSPAGPDRIAFASRIDGVFQICAINPDGTGLQRLTSEGANNEAPTWSPNGRLLAFESDRSGTTQIYTMFADDGSSLHQLTRGTSTCHSPAWSPMRP